MELSDRRIVGTKFSRVTDLQEQQAETYRHWRSRPIIERFLAVWEASALEHLS